MAVMDPARITLDLDCDLDVRPKSLVGKSVTYNGRQGQIARAYTVRKYRWGRKLIRCRAELR